MLSLLFPWDAVQETGTTRTKTILRLLAVVLGCRSMYLVAMAVSCHYIPEHNPGDDVMRFDMRLVPSMGNTSTTSDCFCLQGHVCDKTAATTKFDRPTLSSSSSSSVDYCAIPYTSTESVWISSTVWNFILSPLTKWDAARFLNLAVRPSLRDPQIDNNNQGSWDSSEQAHAFFPMFPWILQQLAWMARATFPSSWLPPTYEGLVVFCGLIWNNLVCLIVATLSLYQLTHQAIIVQTSGTRDTTSGTIHLSSQQQQSAHNVAIAVCLVYGIWNPACVFFATNYSESVFSTMTLLGHVCMQKCKGTASNTSMMMIGTRALPWWCTAITCWTIASYTRSNGILQCLWLTQDGLARIVDQYQQPMERRRNQPKSKIGTISQVVLITLQTLIGIFLITFPVRYHDWRGYERHCRSHSVRPSWCMGSASQDEQDNFYAFIFTPSFSLYRYVQEKHWNVGLFRYFQWKQLPNFLLAAPILGLSFAGALRWIHWSFITDYGKGKLPSQPLLGHVSVRWPLHALSESVRYSINPATTSQVTLKDDPSPQSLAISRLVENPHLLGHYAILFILAVIGFVLAHVQISTRMICSSSPAALWFLTYCMIFETPFQAIVSKTDAAGMKHNISSHLNRLGQVTWLYTGLYMLLGIVLHVNFLPWT